MTRETLYRGPAFERTRRAERVIRSRLAMGRRPPGWGWSALSAISLGYRRRDELSASGAARACAMGGAPVWKCGGVDVNTQHDVSIGLESLFHFLGHLQPSFQLGGILSPSSKSRSNAG